MLNTDLDPARRHDHASPAPAKDQVAVRFQSQAALERALALAEAEPWVAHCRIERATRTLHLRLCSGVSPAAAPRFH